MHEPWVSGNRCLNELKWLCAKQGTHLLVGWQADWTWAVNPPPPGTRTRSRRPRKPGFTFLDVSTGRLVHVEVEWGSELPVNLGGWAPTGLWIVCLQGSIARAWVAYNTEGDLVHRVASDLARSLADNPVGFSSTFALFKGYEEPFSAAIWDLHATEDGGVPTGHATGCRRAESALSGARDLRGHSTIRLPH